MKYLDFMLLESGIPELHPQNWREIFSGKPRFGDALGCREVPEFPNSTGRWYDTVDGRHYAPVEVYPTTSMVLYIPGGAGFLPSTLNTYQFSKGHPWTNGSCAIYFPRRDDW